MPINNDEKIYVLTAKNELPKTILSRLVGWYRRLSPVPKFLMNSFLFITNWLMRIATLGLWYIFIEPIFREKAKQLELQDAAKQFENNTALDSDPPPSDPINIKTNKKTFTHINDYVIHNNMIWYRRRKGVYNVPTDGDIHSAQLAENDGPWQRLFFDGALKGKKPVTLSADGANLSVIDEDGGVHYRKILLEGRGYHEIHHSSSDHEPMTDHFGPFDLETNDQRTYVAVDISKQMIWAPHWYNFPFLHRIVNFFMNGLKLTGLVAHSHRGRFNDSYTDADGNKHATSIGCTTTYQCPPGGTEIIKHDPWAPTWAKIRFYFPEDEEKAFIASRIDSSASCIAALGYEVNKTDSQGQLTLWVNLCDIDILGGNPLLHYTYQTETAQKGRANQDVRVLPDLVENEGWKKIQLPEEASTVYDCITVVQGYLDKRLIRLAAKHHDGTIGYFEKEMTDNAAWTFHQDNSVQNETPLPAKRVCSLNNSETGPKNCSARLFPGKKAIPVDLKHFGQHAYHSEVELTSEQGTRHRLGLHKRWGLKTFFGIDNKSNYELVIPKNVNEPSVIGLFGGKRVIPVKVKEHNNIIEIKPR